MIRSKSMLDQYIRNVHAHNLNSHNKIFSYQAWLPEYEIFYKGQQFRPFIPIQISYNATAYNATVDIVIDPAGKILRGSTPFFIFQGVSYRRIEDQYNSITGMYYACRDALQIGWDMEYRDAVLLPFQRNVWSSIRVLVQVLHEMNDFEHTHFIRVIPWATDTKRIYAPKE